jgi:PAS domain S-box-containing protein
MESAAATATSKKVTTRSIRVRAALLTSLLVAIALIAVIFYTFWALRVTLIRGGEARVTGVAAQLAGAIGPPIPTRLAEIQRLVDDDRVRRAVTDPSEAAAAAAFERLRPIAANTAQHQTLELWSASGRQTMGRRIPEDGRVPLSTAPPTATGVLPFKRLDNDLIVLEAVVPVRTSDGASIIGNLLSRRIATNASTPDTVNRLLGAGGRVLLGNQSGPVWSDQVKAVEAPPIDASIQGVHHYRTANGEARIAGVAHLSGTPLAILVEFPEHVLVAPAWAVLRQLALVGLLFILLAVVVVWHISGRVTRPLDELTAAVHQVAGGDFSRRVYAGSDSEVGQLGHAFNAMAAKIEAGLQELEAQARRLKEEDERKTTMMNVALDGIVTTDTAGRILECNPAAASVFRYDTDGIVGRNLGVLLGLPRFDEQRQFDHYVAHDGALRLGTRQQWMALRSDGTAFPAEAAVVSIRTGGHAGFAAFIRDLTEQKAAEASVLRGIVLEEENRRVQEASRLKSEFLANMSHELRTPLNAIIGFAELLYDGQVTPDMPEFRDFMHDILRSGQHLLQLINDVLDLSKVEAGRLEFHPEETSLEQVVGESIAMLRPLAAQKSLTLDHDVDAQVAHAFVDRGRLKQVLYNYLSNAIKFTPENGHVSVQVRAEGPDHFRVDVIDTGIGIAAADLPRLFVEFNQLEAGEAKKHQGTGLGLALTRRLVEAQGGRVEVSSTPGRGSMFSAILPRRVVGGTPLAGPRSIPSSRIGAPTVLVIEDDAHDQEAIVSTLAAAGFNIETANSRTQVAAKLNARGFDAITLDLILPDANGAEVLHDIRSSPLNEKVPVVVITVVADSGAVTGFAVHDILSKPVDGAAVVRALERAGVSVGSGGTVLVVDDDPGSLRLMAASLQQLGYHSTCVARAIEGLRISEREAPMAVVLDLQMPELDGFGFLDRFRRIASCEHVPVIVWTVKDLTQADLARLKQSVQGVMSKGQSGRSVVDELRRFVAAREARR